MIKNNWWLEQRKKDWYRQTNEDCIDQQGKNLIRKKRKSIEKTWKNRIGIRKMKINSWVKNKAE